MIRIARSRQAKLNQLALVKAGFQEEADGSSMEIPYAVVIGGDDAEVIFPRWQIGVVGHAARSGFDPLVVVPFQPVFEADPLRECAG